MWQLNKGKCTLHIACLASMPNDPKNSIRNFHFLPHVKIPSGLEDITTPPTLFGLDWLSQVWPGTELDQT